MKANELKDKSIEQLNSDLLDLLKAQFGFACKMQPVSWVNLAS